MRIGGSTKAVADLGGLQSLEELRRGDGIVGTGTADGRDGGSLLHLEHAEITRGSHADRLVGIFLETRESHDHVHTVDLDTTDASAVTLVEEVTRCPGAQLPALDRASTLLDGDLHTAHLVEGHVADLGQDEDLLGGTLHDHQVTVVTLRCFV